MVANNIVSSSCSRWVGRLSGSLLLSLLFAAPCLGQAFPPDVRAVSIAWEAAQPRPVPLGTFQASLRVYDYALAADVATTAVGLLSGNHREANPLLSWTGKNSGVIALTAVAGIAGHFGTRALYRAGWTRTALWMARITGAMHGSAAVNNVWQVAR